jgi:hypothetical protein
MARSNKGIIFGFSRLCEAYYLSSRRILEQYLPVDLCTPLRFYAALKPGPGFHISFHAILASKR